MEKIKTVIREKLPETNSSSSHSVCIATDKKYVSRDVLNFPYIEDNKIFIPTNRTFGWEWEKYNDVLTKTQYVLALLTKGLDNPLNVYKQKKINIIKRVILDFTGAKDLVFGWDDLIKDSIKNNETLYDLGLTIDHNSYLDSEILESMSTIKDFIFNPKSWLFLGNDNGYPPNTYNYYKESTKDKVIAVASIEFPEPYGRVDLELYRFPISLEYLIGHDENIDDMLRHITINKNNKDYFFDTVSFYFSDKSDCLYYLTKEKIKELDNNRFSYEKDVIKKRKKYIESNFKENIDYIKYDIKFKTLEFGDIIL